MTSSDLLQGIDHFVVVAFENRSFDHMLGFLYADSGNVSPLGHPFEGLTGHEQNKTKSGEAITISKLQSDDPYCYFTPHADPGEGFPNTSSQLYSNPKVVQQTTPPTNSGFVTNYEYTLSWEEKAPGWNVYPGATPAGIMAAHTPETLPVLSGLAKGYAVLDHWFCAAPTETQPNRAFLHMATSEGLIKNNWKYQFTSPSVFSVLEKAGATWSIYAYNKAGLSQTRFDIADLTAAPDTRFGTYEEFTAAAAAGTLPNYSFLEPNWGAAGNSQHPNYNVAAGEQWLAQIYQAVQSSPAWDRTLLIITFDEHGGCYDHVAPPAGAAQPDKYVATNGFKFTRFGVRVPMVMVSPRIAAGTVYRVPEGATVPFDHTSILKTLELRFGAPPLNARDAAAPDFGGVLTLASPRTDDPLKGVTPPTAKAPAQQPPTSALDEGLVQRVSHVAKRRDPKHYAASSADRNRDPVGWAHDWYSDYCERSRGDDDRFDGDWEHRDDRAGSARGPQH